MLRPALLAALAALACERADQKDPPPPPPEAVVAIASTASLSKAMGGVRAFAEAFGPGGGALVSTEVAAESLAVSVGASSLAGLDLDGPIHLIALDGPARTVLVGRAADRGALDKARGAAHLLVRDGWALIGPRDAVELVAKWAVPALVATRPTAAVEATLFVDRLMTRHAAEVTRVREELVPRLTASATDSRSAEITADYLAGLFHLAGDTTRAVLSLAIDSRRAELDLALVPRGSSRLARFVAAQKPSDFSLVESLPAGSPTGVVMAGHLELGPYRDAAMLMFSRMTNFDDGGGAFDRAFARLADLSTGDFAAGWSMKPDGISMAEVIPVSDAAAAEKVVREVAVETRGGVAVTMMGLRLTHTGHPDLGAHAGTPIHAMTTTIALDSLPAEQRALFARLYGPDGQKMHVAFPPGALVATIGERALCEQAIDARTGRGPRLRLASSMTSPFQEARARRDSILFVMDVAGLVGGLRTELVPGAPPPAPAPPAPGVAISLGFADRSAHLRMSLPADTVRAVVASGQ